MKTLFSLVCLVLINVCLSYSLECYSCLNIDDANNCGNTTICQNGQSCYLDFKHTGASTSYSLGCKDNQMCGNPSSSAGELIGRGLDKRQTSDCSECCSIDNCNKHLCEHSKLYGGWSTWGQWETCSVTCDIGIQRRHRNCSNPYPDRFGDPCFGDGMDDRLCLTGPCANGGWSDWDVWSSCSTSCGGGIKSRTRECNNPFPSLSGKTCEGSPLFITSCNVNPCPIPSIIFRGMDLTTLSLKTGDTIIFTRTTINEGNAYDNKTGIFKAPVVGTYLFSAHLCVERSNAFGLAFISDNVQIHRGFISQTSNVHCDSSHITIPLQKDSQVYLKSIAGGMLHNSQFLWNTFSGSLLHL